MTTDNRVEELELEVERLRDEVDALQCELRRRGRTYEPAEVEARLWSMGGRVGADELTEFAWSHPEWFRHGVLTAYGAKHVRLTGAGLVFTWHGADVTVRQFTVGAS